MSAIGSYTYEPLPTSANSTFIRFLRVLPDLANGCLQCELTQAEIEARQYTALSYTWGPQTDDRRILVNRRYLLIRRNLWDFLHLARQHYHDRYFWIDAICIDQSSNEERNHQVSMMGSIYQQAASTLIWLGPFGETFNTPDTPRTRMSFHDPTLERDLICLDDLFDGCRKVDVDRNKDVRDGDGPCYGMYGYKTPMRPWITPNTWIPPKYGDFSLVSNLVEIICEHSYWSRLWIIQETGLSNNKSIVLPGYTVASAPLLRVLKWVLKGPEHPLGLSQVLVARSKLFKRAMDRDARRIHFSHELTAFPPGYAPRNGGITTKLSKFLVNKLIPAKASMIELDRLSTRFGGASPIFSQIKNELSTEGRQYLHMLEEYKHSQCSDRRDKIYGLNSLMRIHPGGGIHVDYSENVYDLYFRISRLLLLDDQDRKESEVCLSLMQTLNLGPLDLVFGDEERRTEVYRCGSPEPNESPWPLKVLKEEVEDGKTVALEGTCHRCDRPIKLRLYHRTRLRLFECVIQCHDLADSADADQKPISNHILVYDSTDPILPTEISESRCSSEGPSAIQKPTANPRLYSFGALITILRLHEAFYRVFDDRPWDRENLQGRRQVAYMPPPWIHGRPSRDAKKVLHEYIQQWLSILAPKEKIGYTWDMLDAVWLEDKAKPGFIKALAEHGFNLISSGQWSLRFDRDIGWTVDVTLASIGPLPR